MSDKELEAKVHALMINIVDMTQNWMGKDKFQNFSEKKYHEG
jgi:hypothetical protein